MGTANSFRPIRPGVTAVLTPGILTRQLVAQVRARVVGNDAEHIRTAFQQVLKDVLSANHGDAAWADGADVIGEAYQVLIGPTERRATGQFFTPLWAGELMSSWVYAKPRRLLLDPGCGSGSLTISAADHAQRGQARILAIDRDPLAVQMARTNCAIRRLREVEVLTADFLIDEIPGKPDAVICNPPYLRHQAIPRQEKIRIHSEIEQRLGLRLSQLSGTPVLFLLRCLEIVSSCARLAFITPAHWLDVTYAGPVRQRLLECAHVEAIVLLEEHSLFFDRTLTTAAITLIQAGAQRRRATSVIRLGKTLPETSLVLDAIAGHAGELTMDHIVLSETGRWARPSARRTRHPHGERLCELARIRRGIATGANSFFVVSEACRRELGLPISHLRLCIVSPKKVVVSDEITEDVLAGLSDHVPRWLLNTADPTDEMADTSLGRYLRYGRDVLRVHERALPCHRRPWFAPEQRGLCPILFGYLNRERPRFVRNRTEAAALNNWLIIEPVDDVTPDDLWHALQRLSVTNQVIDNARVYGRGMWKLEPRELGEIRVPIK